MPSVPVVTLAPLALVLAQGLAMARSFGDSAAESVGVFAEPELTEVELTSNDKFFIWASDGVWEFITSQEAVDIVSQYLDKTPQEVRVCVLFGVVPRLSP